MRSLLLAMGCVAAAAAHASDPPPPAGGAIRLATYNVSLYRDRPGRLVQELASGRSRQARRIAEVVQRVRPDVLLLNEIDYDPRGEAPRLLAERYLAEPQADGLRPLDYGRRFTAPVNTGVPSGLDLDRDGAADGPNDAWGYGRYPGQYGMAVLSQLPIDRQASRTFQTLRWSDLPDARQPVDPGGPGPYYPEATWRRLRLPSKSFWDVVVCTPGGAPLHLVCSHPTPPVFDGPEDRNGRRNADEVRLVREYVEGTLGGYFVDDQGRRGALPPDAAFVVLGDLNADPADGEGREHGAIGRLLGSGRLAHVAPPTSRGAVRASQRFDGLNSGHAGNPAADTADFSGDGHGNLRVDYVLPSDQLTVLAAGVYWPAPGEAGADAVRATDHRLVWVDIAAPHGKE
ncbi:endonuclease/exonuclease/phosphatase family protein [Botrimarina sp.]|uniref:endonuclease/exonuclease/phosphatase family protein n=1 Tax=Botrimarina sp. TaxID=2795802 RepID=UPI0032EFAAF8